MKTFRRILTVSALCAAACSLASADLIETLSCGTVGPAGTELTSLTTGNPLTCAGANLGSGFTLISATLTLTDAIVNQAGFLSTITVTEGAGAGSSNDVTGTTTVNFSSASGANLAHFAGFVVSSFAVSATVTELLAPGNSKTDSVSNSASTGGIDTTAADLAAWKGASGFTITETTVSGFGASGGGGFAGGSQSTFATAHASIVYDYVIAGAPEPATYALMGSALIGLGLLRKRLTGK